MTEHNEDTVERVAKAMWDSRNMSPIEDANSPSLVEIYRGLARAALSAMPPQEVTVQDCIAAVEDCYFIPDNDIDEAKHDGITLAVEALRALSEGE